MLVEATFIHVIHTGANNGDYWGQPSRDGADGRTEQTLDTGAPRVSMNAIAIVQAERGELQLELLNADGSVALAVKGRPDEAVSRSGTVTTDAQGRLRYRVSATGARNGSYQVFFQRTAP